MATPYPKGADLPDLAITWLDHNGAIHPFASGYTFSLKCGVTGEPALFTKDSGFTGADTAPNLVVAWATSGELNELDPNRTYTLSITATRSSDGKERKMKTAIYIEDTVEDEGS